LRLLRRRRRDGVSGDEGRDGMVGGSMDGAVAARVEEEQLVIEVLGRGSNFECLTRGSRVSRGFVCLNC
jgi:hypothetical protein